MRSLVLLFLPLIQAGNRQTVDTEDDDAVAKIDVLDRKESVPKPHKVPFGHIFKEGIEDPFSDVKTPVDVLEYYIKTPRSRAEAVEMLRDTPPERIIRIDKKKFKWNNDDEDFVLPPSERPKKDKPMWIDFSTIQANNLMNRPIPAVKTEYVRRNITRTIGEKIPKGSGFPTPVPQIKWTNCTEFAKKSSSFHPKDLIDIEWTPFYTWSLRIFPECVVHKYTYPTKRVVQFYKHTYERFLERKLDWNQPKLLMVGSVEALLIADPRDRRGLFHAVLRQPMSNDSVVLNKMEFVVPRIRLKIVEPYLAMSFCEEFFTTIMTSPDNPLTTEQEKTEEAKILNFTGIGYPVKRNIEAEEEAKRYELIRQKELEDMKYIKAVGVENLRLDKSDYFK